MSSTNNKKIEQKTKSCGNSLVATCSELWSRNYAASDTTFCQKLRFVISKRHKWLLIAMGKIGLNVHYYCMTNTSSNMTDIHVSQLSI